MKIAIARSDDGKSIAVVKDFDDIQDRGEIAHIICELETIKIEMIELWDEWEEKETK